DSMAGDIIRLSAGAKCLQNAGKRCPREAAARVARKAAAAPPAPVAQTAASARAAAQLADGLAPHLGVESRDQRRGHEIELLRPGCGGAGDREDTVALSRRTGRSGDRGA